LCEGLNKKIKIHTQSSMASLMRERRRTITNPRMKNTPRYGETGVNANAEILAK
jgi:hypothetical protein